MSEGRVRKIIHIDMDAFYASVEQRDNRDLKNRPVAVGYPAKRGVVAAASYEARRFGVRSAMPSTVAMRRCPELVFVAPRFDVYRAVSQQIHAIFKDYPTRSVIVRRPQCEFRRFHRSTFCHHFVAVLAGILICPRVRSARIAEFA